MICLIDKTEISSFHTLKKRALFNKPIINSNKDAVADMHLGYNFKTGHISSFLDSKLDISELTKKIYEELYSGYAPVGLSSLQKNYTDFIAAWLIKYIPSKANVLEIGCHDGYLLKKLVDAGHTCTGIEPSPYADFASDTYGLSVTKGFFEPEMYKDQSFDVVVIRHVIEHVQDPVTFLRTAIKTLKNNGLIYVEVPNSMWCLENSFFPEFHVDHISYFSLNSLKFLMKEAGFNEVIHSEAFNGYMRFPFIACLSKKTVNNNEPFINEFLSNFRAQKLIDNFVTNYGKYIENLGRIKSDGKLAVWGSGSIGTQYAIDGGWGLEDDIYYIDPNKENHGKKLSVTGHEIDGLDRLTNDVPKTILIASGWEDDVRKQVLPFSNPGTKILSFSDLLK